MPDTSINPPDDDDATDLIASAIHHELYFGGPKAADALVAALAAQGHSVTGDDIEDLLDVGDVPHVIGLGFDADALYVALDGLLEERVFTHRLTANEIASGALPVEPDLKPLMMLTEAAPFDSLEDGSPIVEVFDGPGIDPGGSLMLPPELLAGYRPGDLIGVAVGSAGLRLDAVDQPAEPPEDLRTRILERFGTGEDLKPLMLDELIWRLCNEDPMLFTEPLPPLTELLVSWGLVRSVDYVAPAGFDFSGWGAGLRRRELADAYGLTETETLAVLAVSSVFLRVRRVFEQTPQEAHSWATDDEPAADHAGHPDELLLTLPPVPLSLAEPAVADAVLWETIGAGDKDAAALGALVDSWVPRAPRRVRPSLAWLRGKCLERLGNVLEAEAAFEETLSLEPSYENALVDMARYADDRGDALRAISLLERAGFTDQDPVLADLRTYLPVERQDVGRNDACWCGSGRKYKRCHLGRADLTASQRAVWLYSKATRFARDAPHGELLVELAALRSEYLPTGVPEATEDDTVVDVTLFDGGVLAEFLRVRGVLIPEQERLVIATWLLVDRSVFEVMAVRIGKGVTLQDLRTGDSHDVADVLFSRSVRSGDLVTTRLLPVGDAVEIHGGVEPVPLYLLDRTLEVLDRQDDEDPDPYEVLSVLSARFAPPTVTSGEGDPIVVCAAELEVSTGALADVIELFGERFEPDDLESDDDETDGPSSDDGAATAAEAPTRTRRWNLSTPAPFGTRILAMLSLTGTRLEVQSSTERRFDEVLAVVREADPSITMTAETRTPVSEISSAAGLSAGSAHGSQVADPTDPEVAAVLQQVTADYEKRWLDMELPALSGLTPRQAAVDPTRREDLLRLLTSFDRFEAGPGSMDVARIRRALQL